MTPGEFTEPRLLTPRLLSINQMGAIKELTKRLHTAGRIEDALAFFQAVLEREYMLNAAPEKGVVFPHARGYAVNSLSFAVGLSAEGVPWGNQKGDRAHVIFLLAVPLSEAQRYLNLLSRLSRFVQDESQLSAFRECTQPEQMLAVLDSLP
ncbi:MAG: PTS sugar transporter subunit IIA [Candidatus Omnitrophica bacterium]|nr:PTS sugar transporter subunit IIA [Candidatus Omnitrophota bacterium]